MSTSKALVWFRNNLRLADNEMLSKAIAANSDLVLIYVFDARHWKQNPINLKTSSTIKLNFLIESVLALKEEIEALGGNLIILRGEPEVLISHAVKAYHCNALYTTLAAGVYEANQLSTIETNLALDGVFIKAYAQNTLYHPEDIPWPIKKLPDIFTQFRKENEKQTDIRKEWAKPTDLTLAKTKAIESIDLQSIYGEVVQGNQDVMTFKGGSSAALARLNYYLWETDFIKNYKETRNGLIGADFSSKLSPWLANGSISPKTVYYKLKTYEADRGANQSTYWLYFELLWRDYFHFTLKKYGVSLFSAEGIQGEPKRWSRNEVDFLKWCKGETGIPFIDANMKELNSTGYMSNRGRQLVASFLTNDLNIDWRWGAWYFEYHLIDFDVASNWGNWAYIAGVGNDPRKDRYFNILSQAKKYDGNGDYVRKWLPFLSAVSGFTVHKTPLSLSQGLLKDLNQQQIENYLNPMVDPSKWDH